MASTAENIGTLQGWWSINANTKGPVPGTFSTETAMMLVKSDWLDYFKAAREAMTQLMRDGLFSGDARAAFSTAGIFESALQQEAQGAHGAFSDVRFHVMLDNSALGDKALPSSPRQIMLEGLYLWGTGRGSGIRALAMSMVLSAQPSGVIPWLHGSSGILSGISNVSSGISMANTLVHDPDPNVRLAALKVLADVAYPAEWLTVFGQTRPFAALNEQIPTQQWAVDQSADLSTRGALKSLSNRSEGRVQQISAQLALANGGLDTAQLMAFSTADGGASLPAVPGVDLPWYTSPRTWAASTLGLFAGVMLGNRHSRH